jgi:sarcosine oxidase delta subunit
MDTKWFFIVEFEDGTHHENWLFADNQTQFFILCSREFAHKMIKSILIVSRQKQS